MKAYKILIKDLDYFQKCELAMRTETFFKKQIAPIGKAGEINLFTIFKMVGHSDHSAKIQSKKVADIEAPFKYFKLINSSKANKIVYELALSERLSSDEQIERLEKKKMEMIYKYSHNESVLFWQEYTKLGREIN